MNKRALVRKIIAQLEAEVESYLKAAKAAHSEATHEQNKPENKYDTRGLEAAYLAGAQARQAADARQAIEKFEKLVLKDFPATPIDLSALVEVETRGEQSYFFVGPCKGGLELRHSGREILVLTPQAPLGQQLVGRKAGDSFKWGEGAAAAEYRIISVS